MADVAPFVRLLALNTDLLLNATDGLSDAAATERVRGANSIAFLVAHLIDMRHHIAALAGRPAANPLAPLLQEAKAEDDVAAWPPLASLREWWSAAGTHLDAVLPALTRAQLDAPLQRPLPGGDPTLLGGIAFAVQHESYHLGQIAMLRRMLGHAAMSYRRRPR